MTLLVVTDREGLGSPYGLCIPSVLAVGPLQNYCSLCAGGTQVCFIFFLTLEQAETLNDPEFITERELLKLKLEALHYGLDNYLDFVIKNKDLYIKMGYGEEIESVWMPIWKKKYCTVEQKNN